MKKADPWEKSLASSDDSSDSDSEDDGVAKKKVCRKGGGIPSSKDNFTEGMFSEFFLLSTVD